MKKWIWLTIIGLFVLIGIGINIYLNAVEPAKEAKLMAIDVAKAEADIIQVDDITIYNGSKTYFVVKGKDSSGDSLIVWIPEDNENEQVVVKEEAEGISKQEAIERLSERKQPEKIISVKLGMENRIPLWEIFYRSKNDLINYYYVDFETGEWLKDIQNL